MARLTRTLAASAVLGLASAGALAVPAQAHGGGNGYGDHHRGLSLTRSAAATLDRYDVDLDWARSEDRPGDRSGDRHRGRSALRGTLVFDGERTTTWTKIRVNNRTNRVTAVVNGDRRAVLRFRDAGRHHRFGGDDHRAVLRLTRVGAASIDRAAGADAFDAGDAFARARGCR